MLVSVYIRKDDEEKWRALKNKTQAISDMLNKVPPQSKTTVENIQMNKDGTLSPKNPAKPSVYSIYNPSAPDPIKGYPCCQKKSPCKHWTFDGADEKWTNLLTGEVRDA